MMVIKIFIPKIVDKNIPELAMRMHFLREIDNTVFDDVASETMNMLRLIPSQNRIVTIQTLNPQLAPLIRLNHPPTMLNKRTLHRKINPSLLIRLIKMRLKLP